MSGWIKCDTCCGDGVVMCKECDGRGMWLSEPDHKIGKNDQGGDTRAGEGHQEHREMEDGERIESHGERPNLRLVK